LWSRRSRVRIPSLSYASVDAEDDVVPAVSRSSGRQSQPREGHDSHDRRVGGGSRRLLDVAGGAECVEEVAGGVDLQAGGGELLVLRPDGQAEYECEGDGRPVVGVAGGDALFGVLAAVVVVGRGPPLDRNDLECGEQQRGVQAALRGQAWDVAGDLDGTTASAATQRGGCGVAMTSRARPPMSAERTTLASATTAAGSEIVEDLLLFGALFGELCADLFGEA
jgi:hypothetical protein